MALISGASRDDVFNIIVARDDAEVKGVTVLMSSSNSLPSRIVFNSARNDSFVFCNSESVTGSSRSLRMRTALVSLVEDSLRTVKTVVGGISRNGRQTVPVSCRTALELRG